MKKKLSVLNVIFIFLIFFSNTSKALEDGYEPINCPINVWLYSESDDLIYPIDSVNNAIAVGIKTKVGKNALISTPIRRRQIVKQEQDRLDKLKCEKYRYPNVPADCNSRLIDMLGEIGDDKDAAMFLVVVNISNLKDFFKLRVSLIYTPDHEVLARKEIDYNLGESEFKTRDSVYAKMIRDAKDIGIGFTNIMSPKYYCIELKPDSIEIDMTSSDTREVEIETKVYDLTNNLISGEDIQFSARDSEGIRLSSISEKLISGTAKVKYKVLKSLRKDKIYRFKAEMYENKVRKILSRAVAWVHTKGQIYLHYERILSNNVNFSGSNFKIQGLGKNIVYGDAELQVDWETGVVSGSGHMHSSQTNLNFMAQDDTGQHQIKGDVNKSKSFTVSGNVDINTLIGTLEIKTNGDSDKMGAEFSSSSASSQSVSFESGDDVHLIGVQIKIEKGAKTTIGCEGEGLKLGINQLKECEVIEISNRPKEKKEFEKNVEPIELKSDGIDLNHMNEMMNDLQNQVDTFKDLDATEPDKIEQKAKEIMEVFQKKYNLPQD